ncbi:MAG TPA: ABC transporter permease [Rhodocyclaceae bacterium]|nr:ABC transporter permease [Rhodocyclaceae bacterium]HMV53261.1 ABC transporter permease [Rhodocyclaceae bacterium]HMZ84671.1 ABC transporter permease [Rhodocyclaceae bacterium]HNB77584.1 ABC transporter permease [Rhodocyclaceae bacterium]HNC62225.1 ABC transporter permease [Rhodocyclaceae bacterium]
MPIPLSYSLRNLWTRRLTTVLTAGGMALVVFVYAAVLMLDEGLKKTLVDTGSYDNVVAIRKGAGTEVQSGVERAQAALVESQPQVALGAGGRPLASKEAVVLISLPKRGTGKVSNVLVRGVGEMGLALRPQVRLVAGRMFRPGAAEVVAGRSIAERFEGGGVGETLRFGGREWTVVGIFDAGKSGFDSEVWGDADLMMPSFRRVVYSSVIVRLAQADQFDALRDAIEADPRIKLELKRERQFYADQSEALSRFLRILGITLSVIFSIGAIIGAMITMYAAVANRTGEIGTLRAIGFRKSAVMLAFLAESLFLALLGGIVGLVLASFMQLYTISTMNWQSFAELAFSFRLTPAIVVESLLFSLIMGLVGGFLPAARAARMNITEALRSA